MQTKQFETNLQGLLKFIHDYKQHAEVVYVDNVVGAPTQQHFLPKIFLRDGTTHTLNGWTHFINVFYDLAKKDAKINLDKTTNQLKKQIGDYQAKQTYIVEYIPNENTKEFIDKQEKHDTIEEETLKDVKQLPDIELIEKVCEEETAKEFKKWLKEYLDTFPTFEYSVPSNKGKKRIAGEIKDQLEGK